MGAARSSNSALAGPESAGEGRPNVVVLAELESRLAEAEGYLKIADARARRDELEELAGKPDLWDDQDRARQVTTELGRVSDDLDRFDTLALG